MPLVAPAHFISDAAPFTKHHASDLFHDSFSDDGDLTLVAGTKENASPSPSPSLSMSRLINLKRRFKKVLRIPNKRQNMVEPNTMRRMMTDSDHQHHPTAAVPTLSSAVCGISPAAPKGILKKQSFVSAVVARPQRKVRYNERVVVHDTFGSCEYDRSIDTLASNLFLTPEMAHGIKEDLNHFKFNEMQVHPASRVYTHFFI